ncbi:MAG: C-type cytochrome biosis protein [Chloroflexi bacterium]|nr:C-type cytochrome biosis protein [Chloroflexota bacterium]
MNPADVTVLLAVAAGLLSFLSPCVLPLVPAYVGQLTVVAVASGAPDARPSRWLVLRHAIAYVLGFGLVFTLLGVAASIVGGALLDVLPVLRTAGGILLILLGLNLAGILPVPVFGAAWRPLDAGAAGSVATAGGSAAVAPADGADADPGLGQRLGGTIVSGRGGLLASFGLGVVFAVGWTPCIGVVLGAILAMAADSGTTLQGGLLLAAYCLGLGLPFLAIGVLYDRAPAIVRPLVRHGRAVSFIGGMLVVAVGVALVLDWLSWISRLVPFTV